MKERILGVYTISICSLFILTSYSSAISTYQETVPITIDHKQLPIVYIDDDYNENTPGWGFDHFSRIQHGINAIETGGTAIVFNGIYYENVIVDKTINLIGESKENTIIDAQGSGNVVFISSSQVSMSEFTIRNSAIVDYHYGCFYGLLLTNTMQTRIENILVDNNDIGIGLYQSVSNHITQSTIKNSSNQGIKIFESNNNTIENVICYDNMYGIFVGYSQQVKIKNTTTYHNSYGIYLASANNNRLENNTIYSNINWGIFLEHAEHNTLRNNEMARNTYNFWIDTYANSLLYYQDIDTSNTVDAKPIYYLVDVQDYVIPTDAGFVGVIHSENITVKNITFSNNSDGVVFALTTNSTIDNVTVTNCYHGIHLWNSDQNTITRYYGSQNIVGIYLEYFSNNNNITNNTCILSNYGLVTQYQCNNNIITYNRFILNFLDIEEYCSPNIFLFNQFSFNLENRMMQFQEVEREKILNDEVEFSLSIYDAQGNPCDDFNYSIQTSPSELVSANHQGNMLMGSFRLTMNGTYSLIVTVCDNNNNTVRNRWTFFVNPTGVETI
jgi:parallel beta-helix repeat protein